mmetsp:Transcript_7875/g.7126  ORF Transcript_7875/g.7126 Transcript_7875/m.7126 type:complete len:80 (-) Transcript_7875:1434-1673(-)
MHGTEFLSTSMIAYLTSYLVYGYLHKDETITYLLENRRIWLIPVINADAYIEQSEYFPISNRTKIISKNMRDYNDDLCG